MLLYQLVNSTQKIADELIKALLPAYCLVCKRPIARAGLCSGCRLPAPNCQDQARCLTCFSLCIELNAHRICKLCQAAPPLIQCIRYLWEYGQGVRAVIRQMKYRPSLVLANHLGRILARSGILLFSSPHWDLILPVPSSIRSLRIRAFNQCQILAETCVRHWPRVHTIPTLDCYALSHCGFQTAQAGLPHRARLANVAHAFRADSTRVMGRRVLLIDDVITTGATAASASHALLTAGARSVDILALARSPSWAKGRHAILSHYGDSIPSPAPRIRSTALSKLGQDHA